MTTETDYARLCQELRTKVLDSWREYTLLRLPIHDDPRHAALWWGPSIVNGLEATYVLKTTCTRTGTTYAARVPPNLTSAREAATWINQGIDPEYSAVETITNTQRKYPPEVTVTPHDDYCYHDVHCCLDEDELSEF